MATGHDVKDEVKFSFLGPSFLGPSFEQPSFNLLDSLLLQEPTNDRILLKTRFPQKLVRSLLIIPRINLNQSQLQLLSMPKL
jgi:hypothetical protein